MTAAATQRHALPSVPGLGGGSVTSCAVRMAGRTVSEETGWGTLDVEDPGNAGSTPYGEDSFGFGNPTCSATLRARHRATKTTTQIISDADAHPTSEANIGCGISAASDETNFGFSDVMQLTK